MPVSQLKIFVDRMCCAGGTLAVYARLIELWSVMRGMSR